MAFEHRPLLDASAREVRLGGDERVARGTR